ncbi:hypothetical protein QN382_00885 [Pseudomonas sp. 10B1]|uniref:toxin VasX n=2 Tax=Pseudomonas TaxID=286 RepID=UPI002AB59DFC|nr:MULTISPECIES: toxin VasX [unclassified Pseudomonas]MDY7560602.1 hypothetical protein [Pseudomonas sp. AB6]MEA9993358.1 hypothetical protein [Pseudomonas sp. AA4]MEB0124155.1 hypothetical protein [Pseudomonas sp. CCC1.2]MEB0152614.1 hypothetical protein [Pseudomonas sp. CCC4.3]MEB0181704.1 hypothetical protein [Pseudomonas sp. CCC3.2]
MTNLMTPRGHLANLIAKSRSHDSASAGGACPLTKTTIQLLPLRYGLVEHLTPPSDLPMPHTLQSKAMGIRLLRDGYLYVVDSSSGFLHEYLIEQGSLSKLLWDGAEVASDVRQHAVGNESTLIVPRNNAVYVAYSEIQWTAYKCSQVIQSATERERFMQRVNLASASSERTAKHLLTESQASAWLAEVAENRCEAGGRGPVDKAPTAQLPEGANPEENTAYLWEQAPLFRHTWIEELTSQVGGAHKNDFLFLVVRDDIGIMRDLAAAQLKVADWMGEWADDDIIQRQYVTGSYIQSLYTVNQKRLVDLARDNSGVTELLKDINESEQETLVSYLHNKREYQGPTLYGDELKWREMAKTIPFAESILALRDALGGERWQKHEQTIAEINLQTYESLHGAEPGERGIDDLVQRQAMQTFVLKQQTLLQHWQGQLKRIRADRLKMIVEGHFHRAAWYYDFQQSEQIKHRLETELLCVAAICDDQDAWQQLETYLEKNPLVQVPGLDTLGSAEQDATLKELADLSNISIKIADAPAAVAEMDALANQFNSLMRQRLPNYMALTSQFEGLNSLLGGAYDPALQMTTAHQLELFKQDFERGTRIDLNSFIRNIGPAARLRLLRTYATSGLTLRAATSFEIENFNRDRSIAIGMRRELKQLYKERRLVLIRHHAPNHLNSQIANLKNNLTLVEDRLTQGLTPGGKGPGQIGLVLGNMDAELSDEMQRTVRDYRSTGTFKKPIAGALTAKGNQIAVVVFYFQAVNFVSAADELLSRSSVLFRDFGPLFNTFVGMSAAGFSTSQGLAISALQAHIAEMESASGKLNAMSRLGKWATLTGLGAFGFGFAAAAFDSIKHSHQWGRALAEGDWKKLAATSMQMSGDAVLMGANGWGYKHTYLIAKDILRLPKELRAMAWAEKSPLLVNIAARANLIGIIGMALQMAGQGIYNYFNLDDTKKWLHHSVWGLDNLNRSLEDDWIALATAVQQPLCEMIRQDDDVTEFRFALPGVSTAELDSREVSIEVHQRREREQSQKGWGRPVHIPPYWEGRSEYFASQLRIVSQNHEALVLSLSFSKYELTDPFGLVIALSYKLEDHQPLRHRTIFPILDIHKSYVHSRALYHKGVFKYKPETELPFKLQATDAWPLTAIELRNRDAE